MNELSVSTDDRSALDTDHIRRAELQVQSVLAAAGALAGAMVTVVAVTYVDIGSEFAFVLGLLAVSIGTAIGVASASRVASALRRYS
jgi:hypothetical protein